VTVSAAQEGVSRHKRGQRAPIKLPKPRPEEKSRQHRGIEKEHSFEQTQKSVRIPSGIQ